MIDTETAELIRERDAYRDLAAMMCCVVDFAADKGKLPEGCLAYAKYFRSKGRLTAKAYSIAARAAGLIETA